MKVSHCDLSTSLSNYIYSPCFYLQSRLKFFPDFSNVWKWRKPGTLISQNPFAFSSFLLLHRTSQLLGLLSTAFTYAFTYAFPRVLGSIFYFFITRTTKDLLYVFLHSCSSQVFLTSTQAPIGQSNVSCTVSVESCDGRDCKYVCLL